MKMKTLLILIVLLGFLSACAQTPTPGGNPPPASTPVTPTQVVPTPPPTSVPTEVSSAAAQEAAIQALSAKYNIPADQIKVVSTEPVTWPNGCLGVVIPGVMCTDVVTDGYRIIMDANGQQYEFHTNLEGTSVIDAAQQLATLGFVVRTASNTVELVTPNIPLGPTYNPAFNGFLPWGGSIGGTAYVIDWTSSPGKAIAINATGSTDLSFIQNPNYALAVWSGGEGASPMLAWGTQTLPGDGVSSLDIAAPDGSNLQTLITSTYSTDNAIQLVAQLWSADGQSLYFSKEPVGIGGYIIFGGASNLYKIDIKTKQIVEIIPQAPATGPQTCLDAISGDYRFVADHCTQGVITVRDLQAGTSTTIQPPQDVTGYRLMGSARFSPTGDRVAFALAQGNPDDERGWVAIGPSSGGPSKLILVGDAGSYYTFQGWLDDQTLLVQSTPVMCTSGSCASQLFTVGADSSNLTKVADGSFLTIIDNR
jgi:hypothetical protein